MHIQIETPAQNTIKSYDDSQVMINNTLYQDNFILSKETIISPWLIPSLNLLTIDDIKPIMELNPKVILIGHNSPGFQLPINIQQWLSTYQIGIESMMLGAACRTFNVLLAEDRHVVAGFILKAQHAS